MPGIYIAPKKAFYLFVMMHRMCGNRPTSTEDASMVFMLIFQTEGRVCIHLLTFSTLAKK